MEGGLGTVGTLKAMAGDDRKQRWQEFLRRKSMKTTRQREAIVDAFLATSGHLKLEQMLALVRRRNPGVGLATVYRTVKLLEEAGLIDARHFGTGETLYELAGVGGHHDHIICTECGHITEFESEDIERLQDEAASHHGFNVIRHRHELFGLCERARGVPGGRCPGEGARDPSKAGARPRP